ncbi:hypothetical protein ACPV5V_21395, partial [Vibrio campbellii]
DDVEVTLIGHGVSADIVNTKNDVTIKANLYIESITHRSQGLVNSGHRFYLEGAVIVQQVQFTSLDSTIVATVPANCDLPPNDDYRIELTPISDIALTCEDIGLTATVYNGDSVYTAFNGNVILDGNSFTPQTSQANAGVATFTLSSGGVAHTKPGLYAEAQVQGSTYRSNTSEDYKFVPYKFDIADVYAIAGKPTATNARVLA